MKHLQKVLTALTALAVVASPVALAEDATQRVVTSVEYKLTESDTAATAKARAMAKAREKALSQTTGYALTTVIEGAGRVTSTSNFTHGKVVSAKVLNEHYVQCGNVEQCLHLQVESVIDLTGLVVTKQDVEDTHNALLLADELLRE